MIVLWASYYFNNFQFISGISPKSILDKVASFSSLLFPRYPLMAASVLLKNANLSRVLICFMRSLYCSCLFSDIISATLLLTLSNCGATSPDVENTNGLKDVFSFHFVIFFRCIFSFLHFVFSVQLMYVFSLIRLGTWMCDPYVKKSFLIGIP